MAKVSSLRSTSLGMSFLKASDSVHATKASLFSQTECEAYKTCSSVTGPLSKENFLKPGTDERCESLSFQIFSNPASKPGVILKRFIS